MSHPRYPRKRKMTKWGPAHTVAHSYLWGKARWQVFVRKTGEMRYEHTLVWEEHNRRKLPRGYVIHHRNGDPLDNRIRNLQAMPMAKHNSLHKLRNMRSHLYRDGAWRKRCKRCRRIKPVGQFPLNGCSAAGTPLRRPLCRVCDKKRQKAMRVRAKSS